jgi:hypothetical protein
MTELETLLTHIVEDIRSPMCVTRAEIRLDKNTGILLLIVTVVHNPNKKVLHNTYLGIKEEYSYILDVMTGKEIKWFYKINQEGKENRPKRLGIK